MPERSPGAGADRRESALPLALFRILFGTCLALDLVELIRHAPFWFDEVPFLVPSRVPAVPVLAVWLAAVLGLTAGCFTRLCAVVNYVACVAFFGVASMRLGFEYHLDNLFILTSFGLIFLPVDRALSIDSWRRPPADRTVGRLPGIFLALVASSIYLDSAVWKLSSRMWMEGLGYWVPASQPWEGQPAFPWTLDNELAARAAGYATLVYELAFVALVWFRRARMVLLPVGLALHAGIALVIPLPLFGLLMVAYLVGLVPWRAPAGAPRVPAARRRWKTAGMALFYAGWALAFALGMLWPLGVLVERGLGGVDGATPRPWHVTSRSSLARLQSRAMEWSYRLFGFRSHPIFLDSQFAPVNVQTRLRYHPPPDGAEGAEGLPVHPPNRNRLWIAWNYRITWPELPREEVEAQLVRFVTFHAVRRGLDLRKGSVVIEQREIELPVTEWRPGQRARNAASPWRKVGSIAGAPGALEFLWQDPSWS